MIREFAALVQETCDLIMEALSNPPMLAWEELPGLVSWNSFNRAMEASKMINSHMCRVHKRYYET
jgi:hypothetical protein